MWRSAAQLLRQLPWFVVVIACLTLGLAPLSPEPHIWEKLKMLATGELTRPIDIFDLVLHGTPFLVALLKLTATIINPGSTTNND